MEKGNSLQFSADGTEFVFLLADGSESRAYTSKEMGFKAITALAQMSKITPAEFEMMKNQILEAEDLPWSEKEQDVFPDLLELLLILEALPSLFSFPSFQDLMHAPDKPVEVAYFKMCDCGGAHGRIYCKKGYTEQIDSKAEAMFNLDHLKKDGYVNEEEFIKVKAEIENSGLDA